MLRLLLLRHAKAGSASGAMDLDRPLSGRGQGAAALMGGYLRDEGLRPDLVLVSPARRTQETWDLVRPLLGDARTREDERIYEAPVLRLLSVVQEVEPEVRTLLMIGHNPGFEDLAKLLAGEGDEDAILRLGQKYPTAGLAMIDFPQESWAEVQPGAGRLERFTTPKSLGGGEDD
jgi:phosphohistidine phosphatase